MRPWSSSHLRQWKFDLTGGWMGPFKDSVTFHWCCLDMARIIDQKNCTQSSFTSNCEGWYNVQGFPHFSACRMKREPFRTFPTKVAAVLVTKTAPVSCYRNIWEATNFAMDSTNQRFPIVWVFSDTANLSFESLFFMEFCLFIFYALISLVW